LENLLLKSSEKKKTITMVQKKKSFVFVPEEKIDLQSEIIDKVVFQK